MHQIASFFTARRYAERGIATASRPSLCLSVCLSVKTSKQQAIYLTLYTRQI